MPSKRRSNPAGALVLPQAVAAALLASLPDVAAVTVTAVVAEVPDYAGPLRGELGANITHAVELALATFLRLAEEPAADRSRLVPALEAAYALGRGEARSGRTMTALLSAYRVGARVAWRNDNSTNPLMKLYIGEFGLSIIKWPPDEPRIVVPHAIHWAYRVVPAQAETHASAP